MTSIKTQLSCMLSGITIVAIPLLIWLNYGLPGICAVVDAVCIGLILKWIVGMVKRGELL